MDRKQFTMMLAGAARHGNYEGVANLIAEYIEEHTTQTPAQDDGVIAIHGEIIDTILGWLKKAGQHSSQLAAQAFTQSESEEAFYQINTNLGKAINELEIAQHHAKKLSQQGS